MTFSNIPNGRSGLGYTSILTNADNIINKKYQYDSDSRAIMSALDIDWCGAQLSNSSNLGAN